MIKREFYTKYFLSIFDGTFAQTWFKWMGWLLTTAALYVLGKAGNSQVLTYCAYFSALLITLHVTELIDLVSDTVNSETNEKPFWFRAVVKLLQLCFFFVLLFILKEAVNVVLSVKP